MGLDYGDDVTALDQVTRLDQPLDECAGLHVGTKRGHAKFGHDILSASREDGFGRCDDLWGLRNRGILEVTRIGYRHLFATDTPDRRIKLPKRLLDDAHADFGGKAAAAPALIHNDGAPRLRDRIA